MKSVLNSIYVFFALTALTGLLYPLFVTLLGWMFFPKQVQGSLMEVDGKVIGSSLIAQNFKSEKYFWPRPSAIDFNTNPSGGSNLAPTSLALSDAVSKRRQQWGDGAPADLLLASGSGLDPHISLASALFQMPRVAKARNLSIERIKSEILVLSDKEKSLLFGQKNLVNVLKLNLSLDRMSYEK